MSDCRPPRAAQKQSVFGVKAVSVHITGTGVDRTLTLMYRLHKITNSREARPSKTKHVNSANRRMT